ncbi:MAG: hypothetical protein C0444_08920 [Microbacterium sp.]|nr:hypothetical protein [Microbacterium sp.]MBA4346481.1 hypothetical protein [Microbacterium sp.]
MPSPPAAAETAGDVGIWYSTWYSKRQMVNLEWKSGFGAASTKQFVADVDGDGYGDAVTYGAGAWQVARSTGSAFGAVQTWVSGHGVGSDEQFLADVSGDGRADAIAFFNTDISGDSLAGDWYVANSTGQAFAPYQLWKSGSGSNADKRFVGDVTGDGRADLVSFFTPDLGGHWAVTPSMGTSFGTVTTWRTQFGSGSTEQFIDDANADGRLDAIYYTAADGSWYAAMSGGNAFGDSTLWTTGHGVGSVRQYVADGNGDGFAEPYVFFSGDMAIGGVIPADGKPGDTVTRHYDRALRSIDPQGDYLVHSGFGAGAASVFQARVSGDAYNWRDSIAFYPNLNGGTWKVERYLAADSVSVNTWAGFPGKPPINYRPHVLGAYQQYDSGDAAVIDEHFSEISSAHIDFLLLDETNGLNNVGGAILNRAATVASRMATWNQNPANRDLKYAIAVGRVQWTNDPQTIEQEARQVWDEFTNNPAYGGPALNYHVNGKPLLVVYTTKANQDAWMAYGGDKSATNNFTVRFAWVALPGEYGWQLPQSGTVSDDRAMVAMPGWSNQVPGYPPVLRDNTNYYSKKVWDVILDRSPRTNTVIINSFNEFAEGTATEVADTSLLVPGTWERWYNAAGEIQDDVFWNMTRDYVRQFKYPADSFNARRSFSSTQGSGGWHYEQWTYPGGVRTIAPMNWSLGSSRWQGTSTWAQSASSWQHPDVGAESVRTFVAPRAGNVIVTGRAEKLQAGGDGVLVRIMRNGTQVWPSGGGSHALSSVSAVPFRFALTLCAGDRVQFVTAANSTSAHDTTEWDMNVIYQ